MLKKKLLPFTLTFLIIVIDQITKALIVKYVPVNTIATTWGGDFFRLVHVRNLGVAFSMGDGLPHMFRALIFILFPLAVLVIVAVYYFWDNNLTKLQQWCLAGILGGGLGNVIDRIFRPQGVVDFLDFKFYGLFGLDRWPVFNVADSAVVVCGVLIAISFILLEVKNGKQKS